MKTNLNISSIFHYNFRFNVDFKKLGNALVKILRENNVAMMQSKLRLVFDLIDMIFKINDQFGEFQVTYHALKRESNSYFQLSKTVPEIKETNNIVDGKFMLVNGSDCQKQSLGKLHDGRVKDYLIAMFEELIAKEKTLVSVIKEKLLAEMQSIEQGVTQAENNFIAIDKILKELDASPEQENIEFVINAMRETHTQALNISKATLRDFDCHKRRVIQQENELKRFTKFVNQFKKQFDDSLLNVIKYHILHGTESELLNNLPHGAERLALNCKLIKLYTLSANKHDLLSKYFQEIMKQVPFSELPRGFKKAFAAIVYGSETYKPFAKLLFMCLQNRDDINKVIVNEITEEQLAAYELVTDTNITGNI